jgi:hypothetical protein
VEGLVEVVQEEMVVAERGQMPVMGLLELLILAVAVVALAGLQTLD